MREMVDNQSEGRGIVDNQSDCFNEKEMTSPVQPEMNSSSDMIISNSILQDVTNTVKRRRKSMHKEAIEETASPTLCRKSLEEKEKEEVNRYCNELKPGENVYFCRSIHCLPQRLKSSGGSLKSP